MTVNTCRRRLLKTGAASLIYPPAISLVLPKAAIVPSTAAQAARFFRRSEQSAVDGSANAPPGVPQLPNLLDTYHPVGRSDGRNKNNGHQPPWNVAGVDYRVGINADVRLKNPATAPLPLNCRRLLTRRRFLINGTTTVDGFDFSGWDVLVYGGRPTITNCKFERGFLTWRHDGKGDGGTVRYCEFDQRNAPDSRCLFIVFRNGVYEIEYNVFRNSHHMHFQLTNGQPGATYVVRYNLMENAGMGARQGAHGDWLQMFGGYTVDDVRIEFNTVYQNSTFAATQGFSLNASDPTVQNGNISKNTMVVRANTNIGILISRKWISGTFAVNDNYVDPSYPWFRFLDRTEHWPGPHNGNIVVSGNKNMRTGAAMI